MFRSTLDYYSRLVITNILLSFRFRLRYAMFKFSETLQISWFPSHILSGQFLSPSSVAQVSSPPTLKLKCPKHTLTPDFLVYGPSGEISVFAQQIELTFCFFPPPFLFNLSCCIYKGSFIWWMKKICGRKITYICWIKTFFWVMSHFISYKKL